MFGSKCREGGQLFFKLNSDKNHFRIFWNDFFFCKWHKCSVIMIIFHQPSQHSDDKMGPIFFYFRNCLVALLAVLGKIPKVKVGKL